MSNKKMTNKQQLFSYMVDKWTKKTWLSWWRIDIVYMDKANYAKDSDFEFNPDTSLAKCNTQWQYMTATITVNSDLLETMEEKGIEEIVLHELMHVILNEMREADLSHEERVATFLARSFLSAEQVSAPKCREK